MNAEKAELQIFGDIERLPADLVFLLTNISLFSKRFSKKFIFLFFITKTGRIIPTRLSFYTNLIFLTIILFELKFFVYIRLGILPIDPDNWLISNRKEFPANVQ